MFKAPPGNSETPRLLGTNNQKVKCGKQAVQGLLGSANDQTNLGIPTLDQFSIKTLLSNSIVVPRDTPVSFVLPVCCSVWCGVCCGVRCSALQCVVQCVAVRCSALQCVLQFVAFCATHSPPHPFPSSLSFFFSDPKHKNRTLAITWLPATHCTTLQQTAPHYTKLQHTATHCNTLQHCIAPHRDPPLLRLYTAR